MKELVAKVADILQGAPMLLALLLINGAALGIIAWLSLRGLELRAQERTMLVQLIDRCIAVRGD